MSALIRVLLLVLAFGITACEVPEELPDEDGIGEGNDTPVPDDHIDDGYDGPRIVYVKKDSDIRDFTGLGHYLYYFPAFDLDEPDDFHRTDVDAAYFNGYFRQFVHHALLSFNTRTFSPDALGTPLGVKARGGHASWPVFTLPSGRVGLSGTLYDDHTRQNSNNTFNQILLTEDSPSNFCLNVITDNTNLENIPDVKLEIRSDQKSEDLNIAGHPDFSFDGLPDMYTFRYRNMTTNGKIKIRMTTSSSDRNPVSGAGLAGVMISHISTCL